MDPAIKFDASVLEEFVIESREHFENIEDDILQLSRQKDSSYREIVDKIFRAIHTVKGCAAFLQLEKIGELSHITETLLSALRTDNLKPDAESIAGLLAGTDMLNTMLNDVHNSNEFDISGIHGQISSLLQKQRAEPSLIRSASQHSSDKEKPGEADTGEDNSRSQAPAWEREEKKKEQYVSEAWNLLEKAGQYLIGCLEHPEAKGGKLAAAFRLLRDFNEQSAIAGSEDFERLGRKMEFAVESFRQESSAWGESETQLLLKGINLLRDGLSGFAENSSTEFILNYDDYIQKLEQIKSRRTVPPEKPQAEKSEDNDNSEKPDSKDVRDVQPADRQGIRVDSEKLDMLVNFLGELVIAEAMVTNNPDLAGSELENFERAAQNLRRIITDLQDVAMSMRMVPLSKTFRKTVRLVHDLSLRMGKEIKLELIGEETEVDKTVSDYITDPLLHIIRNCADHGIESPEERKAAGKPRVGNITVEAKHEGGEIIIRVSDDGRGLNREKILAKGLETGLIGNEGKNFSDQDIFRLIFEPGFSTAEKVTQVSGRGVGLDVAKKNLEKLKGRADIRSIPGKGTTLILRIPLTLAVIDGMLVRVGQAVYTVPMLSIRDAFRPVSDQITKTMDGQEIVRTREELIPVIRLHRFYKIIPDQTELDRGILITVMSGDRSICFFADDILGHHQTVIKGLPGYVQTARGISGCTILDNGEVSLILDVGSIIDIVESGQWEVGSEKWEVRSEK